MTVGNVISVLYDACYRSALESMSAQHQVELQQAQDKVTEEATEKLQQQLQQQKQQNEQLQAMLEDRHKVYMSQIDLRWISSCISGRSMLNKLTENICR